MMRRRAYVTYARCGCLNEIIVANIKGFTRQHLKSARARGERVVRVSVGEASRRFAEAIRSAGWGPCSHERGQRQESA